ncbi:MAG TPA: 1-phosphofructokinase [Chthonomonadaceae bacterium]|nr:1-phosphofructokinase [Chthonomonadaceae bacterium]
MILTVTPNAAVDKTYRVEDFCLDRVHRPSEARTVAGGKGVNVARVYQTLGGTAVATGFLGGNNGRIVARALAEERIEDAFLHVRGESRLCIAIVDPKHGTQTEVNEYGPEIPARAVRVLCQRVERLLSQQRFDFIVLSGSLPPQTPATLYADLIGIARQTGTPAVLDASGPALREGLCAHPWMVKPNRFELESVLGRPLPGEAEIVEAACALHADGVAVVAITRGAQGALLVTDAGVWSAVPPSIPFASAVASGDSFVAAFVWAWRHGEEPGDAAYALRLATGAGAANAAVIGAGFCSRQSIYELAAQAQVRPLARCR